MNNEQETKKVTTNKLQQKNEPSIKSKLDELSTQLEIINGKNKKSKKQYKMPGKIRSKLKRLAKSKEVIVLKLFENKGADFEIAKTSDLMMFVEDHWRKCEPKHIFNLNSKYPIVVLPNWSEEPISSDDKVIVNYWYESNKTDPKIYTTVVEL